MSLVEVYEYVGCIMVDNMMVWDVECGIGVFVIKVLMLEWEGE